MTLERRLELINQIASIINEPLDIPYLSEEVEQTALQFALTQIHALLPEKVADTILELLASLPADNLLSFLKFILPVWLKYTENPNVQALGNMIGQIAEDQQFHAAWDASTTSGMIEVPAQVETKGNSDHQDVQVHHTETCAKPAQSDADSWFTKLRPGDRVYATINQATLNKLVKSGVRGTHLDIYPSLEDAEASKVKFRSDRVAGVGYLSSRLLNVTPAQTYLKTLKHLGLNLRVIPLTVAAPGTSDTYITLTSEPDLTKLPSDEQAKIRNAGYDPETGAKIVPINLRSDK